jgi:hypothetical protein
VAGLLCLAACLPSLAACSCLAPESPRLLLLRGERTLALDSLQWLRGQLAPDLGQEFTRLSDSLAAGRGPGGRLASITRCLPPLLHLLRRRAVLAPVALGLLLMLLFSLAGQLNFFLLFSSHLSVRTFTPDLLLVAAALKLAGGLACLLLLPRWGIKLVLLLGCAGVSACCLFLALLSHLTPASLLAWPGSVSLALLLLAHHLAPAPLTWPLLVELAPVHHLSWAVPLLAAAVWALALAQVLLLPPLLALGPSGLSLLAWAGALAGAGAYSLVLWLVPDLRGAALGAMEAHFRSALGGRGLRAWSGLQA